MCYVLCLSTSSDEDLTRFNSRLINFARTTDDEKACAAVLMYPHKWYVGSSTGCSCSFRHLSGDELVFDEPQDWFPEGQEEVEATVELYRVIEALVSAGHQVDCLDSWYDTTHDETKSMKVNLRIVSEKTFRLFEDYHFVFERGD